MRINIFLKFGRPSHVYINGFEVREEHVDTVLQYFECHLIALKGYKITRKDGNVKVEFFTRSKAEKAQLSPKRQENRRQI